MWSGGATHNLLDDEEEEIRQNPLNIGSETLRICITTFSYEIKLRRKII